MREVKLEILRHGRNNNQLLSSLTPYLALQDSEPAVGLQLGFEHIDLLRSLRALNYQHDDVDRRAAIERLASEVERFLAPIRCLECQSDQTHLRLVLSAAELALVPFELSFVPGSKEEHWLLRRDLALTRESRRRSEVRYEPMKRMRVLFAFSDAGGPVPALEHGRALQRALRPWMPGQLWPSDWARYLRVLPNACLDDISELCRREVFSHVHILAHGAKLANDVEPRYGITLYDRNKSSGEVVEGANLASALMSAGANGALAAVTLASCEGGFQGGVIGIGGSVAQELHQAGIAMVLASQFPLTVAGSNLIVQRLYEGLAWGEDPRLLVRALRTELHARFPQSHDWASLVHYFSTGSGFERAVNELRIHRATESLDLWADQQRNRSLVDRQSDWIGADSGREPESADRRPDVPRNRSAPVWIDAIQHTEAALEKLALIRDEVKSDKSHQAQTLRRMATGLQHLAWLHLHVSGDRNRALAALAQASQYSWSSYQLDSSRYDALLMHAVMHFVLKFSGHIVRNMSQRDDHALIKMVEAAIGGQRIRPNSSQQSRAWLLADEVLLNSLRAFGPEPTRPNDETMVQIARDIQAACEGEERMPWYSARRQASRWIGLYDQLAVPLDSRIRASRDLMAVFIEALPDIPRPDWDYGIANYAKAR